ncbi:2-oxoglutarate dehydrogenase E1 subunit family protein [Buchnera aphidicola]|uniref:2-oxoglutarate dehydrogenase E1 subunit family protein n=1 Tax=Buchnera aphidicola TaxID=9 RepID=UPI002092CA4F|nr:hypothetical protein [Buchnera aphidicola]USS94511.1 hypothetical protein M5J13_01710 [Buchnera aphidicola (Periphyllus lyropictus)]
MNKKNLKKIFNEFWINSINQNYIEKMYIKYLNNKNSVSQLWKKKFKEIEKKKKKIKKKKIKKLYFKKKIILLKKKF